MKIVIIGALLLAVAQQKCKKENMSSPCYKGRLAVKGICSNYTIQLVEGKMDASNIESSWTDEQTGKTYTNVFALGSPCSFPNTIKEGDEFYFTLGSPVQNCVVCQAYYPKPARAISINVLDKPCQ